MDSLCFFSLDGGARDAVIHITKDELNAKYWVNKILDELDKIYLSQRWDNQSLQYY